MDPLLIDVPQQFETERMIVRCPMPGDGPGMNAAIVESINELRPWMPWAQTTPSVEESEAQSRRSHAKFMAREDLTFRGWLKDGGAFAVGSGLHRMDWNVPRFEIGYFVCTSLARRGYVSEMVRALERLAFEQLKAHRVEIRCDERNERSWRVAERCGFELEGVLRCDGRATDGSLADTRVYAKVRRETAKTA